MHRDGASIIGASLLQSHHKPISRLAAHAFMTVLDDPWDWPGHVPTNHAAARTGPRCWSSTAHHGGARTAGSTVQATSQFPSRLPQSQAALVPRRRPVRSRRNGSVSRCSSLHSMIVNLGYGDARTMASPETSVDCSLPSQHPTRITAGAMMKFPSEMFV